MKKFVVLLVFILIAFSLFAAEYGAIYKNYSGSAISVANGTTPTYLTGFTVGTSSDNVTSASDKMSIALAGAGVYYVKFDMSFTGSSTAATWEVGVYDENGAKLFSRKRYTGNNSSIGNISGSCIQDFTSLSVAKELKIGVTHDNGSSITYTPLTTHLTVYKIESDPASPSYAELTASSGTSQAINTTTLPIDKFALQYEYPADDWTFASNQLTYSGASGTFLVVVSSSFEKSNANAVPVTYSVRKNSAIDPSMQCKRSINNDIGNLSFSGIISLATNDVIDVAVTTTSNVSLLYNRTTMVVFRIDNASISTNYGGVAIADNSTATTFTNPGDWNNISGTFSSLPSNGLSQSGTLPVVSPSTGAKGYYFAEFTSSITYTAISNDDEAGTSIFKSSTNQSDFTFTRDLLAVNKANDVASVGGVGILPINNTDAISLRISNVNETSDLIVPISSMVLFNITTQGDPTLPVVLSDFSAEIVNATPVINWTTQSETENLGWNIYRSDSENGWQTNNILQVNDEMIAGMGTTTQPTDYQFSDTYSLDENATYYYWLQSVSYSQELELYGPVTLFIPQNGTPEIPDRTCLFTNHPNPFNPQTSISFDIAEGETGSLSIFNMKGQMILQKDYEAGQHSYNWNADNIASGLYFYRLQTDKFRSTKKMLLLK